MMGHKICFYGEIWLIISQLSLLSLLVWTTVIPLAHTTGMSISYVVGAFEQKTVINQPILTWKPIKG